MYWKSSKNKLGWAGPHSRSTHSFSCFTNFIFPSLQFSLIVLYNFPLYFFTIFFSSFLSSFFPSILLSLYSIWSSRLWTTMDCMSPFYGGPWLCPFCIGANPSDNFVLIKSKGLDRTIKSKGLDRALDSAEHFLRTQSDHTFFQAA